MSWRPFEASKDEQQRIQAEIARNTCNLHADCNEADEKVKALGGRRLRDGSKSMYAFHCSIEDCEDCFGY